MRTRHPFPDVVFDEMTDYVTSMGDGSEGEAPPVVVAIDRGNVIATHPDAVEKGTEYPLGFMPHRDANRKARLTGVATFKQEGVSRRELWKQRQRQRRGKLDPELRRLQRKAGAK